jgi:AAA ATPase domain
MVEPNEPGGPHWGAGDRFLGLRDERPVLERHLDGLRETCERERQTVADRLHGSVDRFEEHLGLATKALSGVHETLSGTFREWEGASPDPRTRRRVAAELDSRLAALYRQVRLGPGRSLDSVSPRRSLLQILQDMRRRYGPAVDAFPETASIIKARRRHPEVPNGGRVCDVHEDAIRAADAHTRWPLVAPVRRAVTRLRLWSAYEVLDVPARDIARAHMLVPTVLKPEALADEYAEAHRKAKADLEEGWRIVRSNLDVAVHELLEGEPASPPAEAGDVPHDPAAEIAEIVLGALARAGEKMGTIVEPQRQMAASVVARIEEEQTRTLEQLRHDLERSEKLSVRLRWLGRRAGRKWASWLAAGGRAVRSLWLRVRRVLRRLFFRAEDATLRIGRAIGIGKTAQETLLAFADLPNAEEVEEGARSLPPIYRRLFSLSPLRTREMLVGREESLATLGKVLARWRDGKPASVAVIGPEGSGKTTLLNCFEADLPDDLTMSRHEFTARVPDAAAMLATISGWFELDPAPADLEELAARLLESPPRIVIVEGGHHLLLRTVGSIRLPEAFFSLVLATRAHLVWVVTMRQFPWRRMDELLKVSQYFTHTIDAPLPSSVQLREAILLRHAAAGLKMRFSEEGVTDRRIRKLLLSHPADADVVQEALRDRYFENLFAASGGNMTSALFYWLSSVSADAGGEQLVVASLHRPDASFLTRFDRIYLFTLAELLNHGTLTPVEHAAIFRMRESRSRAVLTYLHQLRLIQPAASGGDQYGVNPVFWHLVSSTLESMRILY